MLFEISNLREKKTSHCGVIEFSAEEGMVNLPYWVRPLPSALSFFLPLLPPACRCHHPLTVLNDPTLGRCVRR